MPQSTYLPPRRRCEAAVALPATLKPGCRSRFTCCLDLEITEGRSGPTCCLVMNARRLSSYLLLCCLNAAVVLLAALPSMQGGGLLTCRPGVDQRPKSSYSPPRRGYEAAIVYLPPCRGCETAVALPATLKTGGRSRSTCRLALDARRLSSYLLH